jgi:hypothetical protein
MIDEIERKGGVVSPARVMLLLRWYQTTSLTVRAQKELIIRLGDEIKQLRAQLPKASRDR